MASQHREAVICRHDIRILQYPANVTNPAEQRAAATGATVDHASTFRGERHWLLLTTCGRTTVNGHGDKLGRRPSYYAADIYFDRRYDR